MATARIITIRPIEIPPIAILIIDNEAFFFSPLTKNIFLAINNSRFKIWVLKNFKIGNFILLLMNNNDIYYETSIIKYTNNNKYNLSIGFTIGLIIINIFKYETNMNFFNQKFTKIYD